MASQSSPWTYVCLGCGRGNEVVGHLFAFDEHRGICEECVEFCYAIMELRSLRAAVEGDLRDDAALPWDAGFFGAALLAPPRWDAQDVGVLQEKFAAQFRSGVFRTGGE